MSFISNGVISFQTQKESPWTHPRNEGVRAARSSPERVILSATGIVDKGAEIATALGGLGAGEHGSVPCSRR